MQMILLIAIDSSEYGDTLTDAVWQFSAHNRAAILPRSIPGVVAGLVKKGYLTSDGSGNEATYAMTQNGAMLYLKQCVQTGHPAKKSLPRALVDTKCSAFGHRPFRGVCLDCGTVTDPRPAPEPESDASDPTETGAEYDEACHCNGTGIHRGDVAVSRFCTAEPPLGESKQAKALLAEINNMTQGELIAEVFADCAPTYEVVQ
jgi:hypothetical protein